jgi:hypothetical protein
LEAVMMGRLCGDQTSLFYEFRLDDRVSKDHLLRRINVFVTPVLDSSHTLRQTAGCCPRQNFLNGRKKKALGTSEQDTRQVLTASNEGMPGSEEGAQPGHHHRLGDVVRAKDTMGENSIL